MKFWLLTAVFLTACLPAAEPLRMLALDGDLEHGVSEVVERILGADATVRLSFLQNKELEGELSADVYLDGGSIGAPMAKDLRFAREPAPTHPAVLEGSFTIPAPDTSKPVSQIVVINFTENGKRRSRVATFHLQWTSLAAVQAALKDLPKLHVFGRAAGLREKLRTWRIPFDDLGAEMPLHIDPQAFAVGEVTADSSTQLPSLGEQSSLLMVQAKPVSMLEVSYQDVGGKRLTLVHLPGAPDWQRDAFLYRILLKHLASIP
ncbi:hypothetical protein [Prosthecobacter sp.]|uniref:hypothetical protein n=1 Tax=Prosthecobacter sp. TaxID=1965333 RepID=UPI00378368DA